MIRWRPPQAGQALRYGSNEHGGGMTVIVDELGHFLTHHADSKTLSGDHKTCGHR